MRTSFCLVFLMAFDLVKCEYKLKYIVRDFKKSLQSLHGFLKEHLINISNKIKSWFFVKPLLPKTKQLAEQGRAAWYQRDANFPVSTESNSEQSAKLFESKKIQQLTTPLLAEWHGRKIETHIIQTEDGYFLTVHRIAIKNNLRDRTVLLHHGLLGSSMDWIMLGPDYSLPYNLADAGYDVWILNARGNVYSRSHASLTETSDRFWDFSFQEMGLIDLPAVIDYIRIQNNVGVPMDFVAHSMGCTVFLVFLSTYPKYYKYLRVGVLIAPLAFMNHIEGPLKILSAVPEDVINSLGEGEFLPSRKVPKKLASKFCKGQTVICRNPLLFLSGAPKRWNESVVFRLENYVPAGGSIKTILHYIQLAKSGKFHHYNDYSEEFVIRNIEVPIAFISSSEDWLAAVPDVFKVFYFIKNPIYHHIINKQNVSHTDFLWDKDTSSVVFDKVLEYLEKGLMWNMMKENEI